MLASARRRPRPGVAVALAVVAAASFAGGRSARAAGPDGCASDCVRMITIRYRTGDGLRRPAYVLLPEWYGPALHPPIPLVISPHGRGVGPRENVRRWGRLPAEGPFAVVNPAGQGRRLELFSWGYRGQIDDLARMPRVLEQQLPWLRIDHKRIYAFGASMGGQESLLLAARHPSLVAGAAAFDAVTDLGQRYEEVGRLRCSAVCEGHWRGPLGRGLQTLMRVEVGGTPSTNPRAYALRSPATFARRLALSRVPLQLWWSRADRMVGQRTQTRAFARLLRKIGPSGPVWTAEGRWAHATEMAPYALLSVALRRFGLIGPSSPSLGVARGPLLDPRLPWHRAVLDADGKLLAWYRPRANLGYDRVLRLGWRFLERRAGRTYLRYSVFDDRTLRGTYWQHSPAFLYAAFVDSALAWYAYSGDRGAVRVVREMLDYHLRHGTSPRGWAWPRVPFPTSCGGDRTYGRCFGDGSRSFYGGVEPDKVGLLGRGYLRLYEATGERRFLQAAIACADALARNVRSGDAAHTPWAFRVTARTGATVAGAEFGGAVAGPLSLLDELVQLNLGRTASYRRARDLARSWLLSYQLNPSSPAYNRWSGFYEDVHFNPDSRNQAVPTLTALYLLNQEDPAEVDPEWDEHVAAVLEWVRLALGRGPFRGAWAIDEQRAPGRPGCCSRVGLGSTTSRWAAAQALLYARTGDRHARELAFRSLNYATYFADSDGRIACCGRRRENTYWFSDGYADYLRSFNWAMAAVPELAPRQQTHLLGSTSVVRSVAYEPRSVEYRTFDRRGAEVLRLRFAPKRVALDGRQLPQGPTDEGFSVTRADGDWIARIRRQSGRSVQISG